MSLSYTLPGGSHYSLYPATDFVVAALKDDLAAYEVKKGTIRFSLSKPVPVKLIERIAKSRAKEAAGRDKSKAAGSKKSWACSRQRLEAVAKCIREIQL